ncbi:MAG: hypothetical protein AAFR47_11780 [Pseudomonadota bacterium]
MRRLALLCLLAWLGACAAPPPSDCEKDGGIGGTGGCAPDEVLE